MNNNNLQRSNNIDCLKGLCILFIIITHYGWPDYLAGLTPDIRLRWGFPFWVDMAVPVFIVISGYLYSNSFDRAGIRSLKQGYAFSNLAPRLIRFIAPLSIVIIAELAIKRIIADSPPFHFDLSLFSNGMGPGTYYIPLLLLFVILIPLVFLATQKYGFRSVFCCFFLNGIYEILSIVFSNRYYTILPLRYLFLISFGCYLSLLVCTYSSVQPQKWHWILSIIASLIGVLFIISVLYLDMDPVITNGPWAGVSYIACLYLLPIMMLFIFRANISFIPLALIGRASFNIFLVQMVYYKFFASKVYLLFESTLLGILLSLLLCSLVGLLFYYVENPITSKIVIRLRS